MGIKRILRYGLDASTTHYVNNVLRHPLESLYRLIRFLEHDEEVDQRRLLQNLALCLPDRVAHEFRQELEYLARFPRECYPLFPYPRIRKQGNVVGCFDTDLRMPYIVHKGTRFYFPADSSVNDMIRSYRYFIEDEGILGTGCREKSPHAYVDERFMVNTGDVIVDIGCSDGLFALDNADRAKAIYLFEGCPRWQAALQATFSPFSDKTSIVTKFVSDKSNGKEVRLEDVVKRDNTAQYFIKMDIEGCERVVLEASKDFLLKNNVRLSCCVYHRQDDAAWISAYLKGLGYETRFSDGYMLPLFNGIQFPYFRHGVIYAWRGGVMS